MIPRKLLIENDGTNVTIRLDGEIVLVVSLSEWSKALSGVHPTTTPPTVREMVA